MSEIILRHQELQATILPVRGGLISSLKHRNREFLKLTDEFNPNGSGWPAGGIPFLFPVAGRSFSKGVAGRYDAFDKDWPMPIHGFSYGMPWTVKSMSEKSAILTLNSSETTLSIYPWNFSIENHISIENQVLELKSIITNLGCTERKGFPMPIAPGFHPYFATDFSQSPLENNINIRFNPKGVIRVNAMGGVDKQAEFPLKEKYSTDHPYFNNGIFMVDSPAMFQLEHAEWTLQVVSNAAKYLVFWTKDRNTFQCIEPWLGVPDALGFSNLNHIDYGDHPFAAHLIPTSDTFMFDMKIKIA